MFVNLLLTYLNNLQGKRSCALVAGASEKRESRVVSAPHALGADEVHVWYRQIGKANPGLSGHGFANCVLCAPNLAGP